MQYTPSFLDHMSVPSHAIVQTKTKPLFHTNMLGTSYTFHSPNISKAPLLHIYQFNVDGQEVQLVFFRSLVLRLKWFACHNLSHSKGMCCRGNCSLNLVKGKEISLEAWTGPESSRRLRLPDFKTVGT
jgi:hypothetical protein